MAIKSICIYYFSGTGNSKKVAGWIADKALSASCECKIYNIAKIDRKKTEKPETGTFVIFIAPTHGFNYPPAMMHFIMCFPKSKNKVAFINTRAGMLIGKYVTPGLSGVALLLSAIVFKAKGYSIKALFSVDLPSNWISLHPGLNKRTVAFLHTKNKERVNKFVLKLLSGKSSFRALYEIVQDVAVLPIAILYYVIGRFFFAKTFYASKDCNNCGLCIKQCPVKAIKLVDNRSFWTLNCESCMKCMGNCPQKAIETGHGFVGLAIALYYGIVLTAFYFVLDKLMLQINNPVFGLLIKSGLFIVLVIVFYRIFHFMLQFRFFERFIVYTSLTKYKFWGNRYKALKEGEF